MKKLVSIVYILTLFILMYVGILETQEFEKYQYIVGAETMSITIPDSVTNEDAIEFISQSASDNNVVVSTAVYSANNSILYKNSIESDETKGIEFEDIESLTATSANRQYLLYGDEEDIIVFKNILISNSYEVLENVPTQEIFFIKFEIIQIGFLVMIFILLRYTFTRELKYISVLKLEGYSTYQIFSKLNGYFIILIGLSFILIIPISNFFNLRGSLIPYILVIIGILFWVYSDIKKLDIIDGLKKSSNRFFIGISYILKIIIKISVIVVSVLFFILSMNIFENNQEIFQSANLKEYTTFTIGIPPSMAADKNLGQEERQANMYNVVNEFYLQTYQEYNGIYVQPFKKMSGESDDEVVYVVNSNYIEQNSFYNDDMLIEPSSCDQILVPKDKNSSKTADELMSIFYESYFLEAAYGEHNVACDVEVVEYEPSAIIPTYESDIENSISGSDIILYVDNTSSFSEKFYGYVLSQGNYMIDLPISEYNQVKAYDPGYIRDITTKESEINLETQSYIYWFKDLILMILIILTLFFLFIVEVIQSIFNINRKYYFINYVEGTSFFNNFKFIIIMTTIENIIILIAGITYNISIMFIIPVMVFEMLLVLMILKFNIKKMQKNAQKGIKL